VAGELILNEVATPSTPVSGKDSLYMSNETLARLRRVDSGGNIWPVSDILLQSISANYTLANVATVQQALNGTTNGAITLPANSSYLIEGNFTITNTGTTSHTWAILFGGSATLTSGRITAIVTAAGASSAITAANICHTTTLGTALVVTAASVSATENVDIMFYGAVRINAAGTFIPQVQLSVATGTAATMLANSYILLTPFGAGSAQSLGNWS
jgi:hypothetical protein